MELNLFLTALPLLPGSIRAISTHLFPLIDCSRRIMQSSQGDQLLLRRWGRRWLSHLSLHCFPVRPGRDSEILIHFNFPALSAVTVFRIWSSSAVHLLRPLVVLFAFSLEISESDMERVSCDLEFRKSIVNCECTLWLLLVTSSCLSEHRIFLIEILFMVLVLFIAV